LRVDRLLPLDLFFPREQKLVLCPKGQIHLFTRASRRSGESSGIFRIQIDYHGDQIGRPELVTPADHDVASYGVAARSTGEIVILWQSLHPEGQGVYWRILDADGVPLSESALLAQDAMEPAVQIGEDDLAHLLWIHEPRLKARELVYATLSDRDQQPSEGVVVATYAGGTGTIFSPPVLGFDATHVYVLWTIEYRSGLEQGSASTFYVSFPKGAPSLQDVRQIRLPDTGLLTYGEHRGDLGYRRLMSLTSTTVESSSKFVAYPEPLSSSASEMPVLLCVMAAFRMDENVQPGMAVFSKGRLIGYQLIGRTRNFSWFPMGGIDANGDLYAVWSDLMGGGNYDVFLATTAPQMKEAINRITQKDAALAVVNLGWSMLSGLSLTPLIIVMLILPLLWIALFYIFGNEDQLMSAKALIALVVAGGLYYLMKLILFSTVIAFPPFVHLVQEPFDSLLMYGLPVLILVLAVAALWVYIKRAEVPRLLFGFFVFSLSDALLTMLVYGPGFFD